MKIEYSYWDKYVDHWNFHLSSKHEHLGDEWTADPYFFDVLDKYIDSSSRVLEIGSGGGKITQSILAITADVTAADISPRMLSLLTDRFPSVKQYVITSLDWDLKDNDFDVVVSFDALIHVEAQDIFFYLKTVRRILRPSGIAILHLSNCEADIGFSHWVSQTEGHELGNRPFYSIGMMTPVVFKHMADHWGFEVCESTLLNGGRDSLFIVRPT